MTEPKLVAVYGTLKLGRGNDHYLREAAFLGTTVTDPEYRMYSMGYYPAVAKVEEEGMPIHLEVYSVSDPETLENLDSLEGYKGKGNPRNLYDVEEIVTKFGPAKMYVMPLSKVAGRKLVESGNW